MKASLVHIIIVNYLNWKDSIECVESILQSDYADYIVYIVDNNSPNDSVNRIMDWGKEKNLQYLKNDVSTVGMDDSKARINLISNDINGGFAAANNLVIHQLMGKTGYVWMLNPDTVIENNTLGELVRFNEKNGRETITGAIIKDYKTKKTILYGGSGLNPGLSSVFPVKQTGDINKLAFISGTCLFTSISNFEKHGLLPEEYFLYWEEADWCRKAKINGAQLAVCESAICYDKISTVIGKGYLAHYYYCRNGLLFISKYMPGKLTSALRSMKGRMIKRLFLFQWNKVKAIKKAVKDFKNQDFHALK